MIDLFKIKFKNLRSERNMSQSDFAEFLGISRPTVGFYENGQRLPDAKTLEKICRKCGVSADYLLGLSPIKIPDCNMIQHIEELTKNINADSITDEEKTLIHKLRATEYLAQIIN